MWNKFKIRIRNPKVVTGIVSGILLILVNTGLIDTHLQDNIMKGLNTVLSLGVGFGIFSNPESHITDDTTK
jgi:uncharacterized membrane protein